MSVFVIVIISFWIREFDLLFRQRRL